jgi:hypothetical protein
MLKPAIQDNLIRIYIEGNASGHRTHYNALRVPGGHPRPYRCGQEEGDGNHLGVFVMHWWICGHWPVYNISIYSVRPADMHAALHVNTQRI